MAPAAAHDTTVAGSGTGRRRVRWDVLLPALVLAGLAVAALAPELLVSADPRDCQLARSLDGPSSAHPFGFSVFGCDYLAETVHAARASLAVGALTVLGTVAVALVLGTLAGYLGGWVDAVVSRATDVWTAVPLLLGGVVVLSALETRSVLSVALVLTLFGWPPLVRLQRAGVLEAGARDHVTAARALGAGPVRILRRHVLPHAVRPLLAFASAYAGLVIGVEATLTYSGVGLQQPVLSWGLLLLQAQTRLGQAPHLLLPAGFLVLTVGALVLLGQALLRPADPRHA
jgi:ABC-type dipeptide/oligopeptide/nickel transport system permease subunit